MVSFRRRIRRHPVFAEGGNTPAKSKDIILSNWKVPEAPRQILGFIGFAIFYL
jgi:hypothetical protein